MNTHSPFFTLITQDELWYFSVSKSIYQSLLNSHFLNINSVINSLGMEVYDSAEHLTNSNDSFV